MIIVVSSVMAGCAISPVYKANVIDQTFPAKINNTPSIGVAQFDAITPSKAMEIGMAFGLIGVFVADAVTSGDTEVVGIALQNETMTMLKEELPKLKINYKSIDLMESTNVNEISKRIKSNRLWGFSSLKEEAVKQIFFKNPDLDFAIHITSFAHEYNNQLFIDTRWTIYDRNGISVAKITTKSVDDLPKISLSNEAYFDKLKDLQKRNILEFVKLFEAV